MGKYRKRPVVIEAAQWFPGMVLLGMHIREDGTACIPTLEGDMDVTPGDWVITGVKGERYPCKPDIFELTYEATG